MKIYFAGSIKGERSDADIYQAMIEFLSSIDEAKKIMESFLKERQ